MTNIEFIKEANKYPLTFSICTIVNDMDEYLKMKESFESCGFTNKCEYLVADNTAGNKFDAYKAIAAFIKQSIGEFIILVHQDVRCVDKVEKLAQLIEDLNKKDKNWALCGNAGCYGFHEKRIHIINENKQITYTNLPAEVNSLDENFIVINATTNISISSDLEGFHLYGTDLCIIADFLGYTSYVIPFLVNHLSKGNLEALEENIPKFKKAYGRKIRSRYMETTCTRFFMGSGIFSTWVLNKSPFIHLIKLGQRIKQLNRRIKEGDRYKKTSIPFQ